MKERARNAGLERLKRSATGCYSAWPGTISYRQPQMEEVSQRDCFQGQSLSKQAAVCFVTGGLSFVVTACTNHTLLNYLSSMWCARFGI